METTSAQPIIQSIPEIKPEKKEFPRTIVWISGDGVTASIAARLKDEGVNVYYCLVDDWSMTGWKPQNDPELLKRMKTRHENVLKSRSIKTLLAAMQGIKQTENYFIICDTNALYPIANLFRKMGFQGLLPTKEDYEFEEDRTKAKDFVAQHYDIFEKGEYHEFKKTDEVNKFLDENKDTFYVGKGNDEDVSAIVPNTDNVEHNHAIIKDGFGSNPAYEKGGMVLEEQIRDIIEFTPEAIAFDGKVIGVNIDIENKPVGAGNEGFQTGDSSSVSFWLSKGEIYDMFLAPMEEYMLRKGQMTVWDASVFYSPSRNKFYFGEYCPNRFGINAVFNELATQPSTTEFFRKIIEGEPLYDANAEKFGASVRIFNLKHGKGQPKAGDLMLGDDNKNVWNVDTKKDEEGNTRVVGYDENVSIVTGAGDTLADAFQEAYEALKNVSYTNGVKRPQHDVMSREYPTSIPNRFSVLQQLFLELQ